MQVDVIGYEPGQFANVRFRLRYYDCEWEEDEELSCGNVGFLAVLHAVSQFLVSKCTGDRDGHDAPTALYHIESLSMEVDDG